MTATDSSTYHPGSAREWLGTWDTLTPDQRKNLARTIDLDFETRKMAEAMCSPVEVNDVRCKVNNVLDAYTVIDIDVDALEVPRSDAEKRSDSARTSPPAVVGKWLTSEEALEDKLPESIAGGLVHEFSVVSVNGASKTGKSIAVTQLAMSIAAGVPFLGLNTKKSKVGYLSLEMPAALMVDRMNQISRDTGVPMPDLERELELFAPTMKEFAAFDLQRPEGRERLENDIRERGLGVAVLDTVYKFALGIDMNDNAVVGKLFSDISGIAQRTGAGIIIIDHAGKGTHEGPVSHSAIGASIKGGAVRTIAALKRTGDGWSLDVEGHYGNWDAPISYTRPTIAGGIKGMGCQLSSAAAARGITLDAVRSVFHNHAASLDNGRRWFFKSQREFSDALISEGLTDGTSRDAERSAVRAIVSAFGCDAATESRFTSKYPVWKSKVGQSFTYEFNESIFEMIDKAA